MIVVVATMQASDGKPVMFARCRKAVLFDSSLYGHGTLMKKKLHGGRFDHFLVISIISFDHVWWQVAEIANDMRRHRD